MDGDLAVESTGGQYDDGISLGAEGEELPGALAEASAAILMKLLYGARYARGDIIRPINLLARNVNSWTRADDKRLHRLFCYVRHTLHYRQTAKVGDKMLDVWLDLYVDADKSAKQITT